MSTNRPVPAFLHADPMTEMGVVHHAFTQSTDYEITRCRWCSQPPDDDIHTDPIQGVVVLSFTDWKQAVAFARGTDELIPDDVRVGSIKREALYKVPTRFCDCLSDKSSGEGNKVKGWKMGPKMGWWVHRNCGRPSPSWGSGFGRRLFSVFGYNLLKNTSPTFYFPSPAVGGDGGDAKA